MYLPSPFARPISSFEYPLDPPTIDPTDSPVQQVCINTSWLPYIAGSLKQLLLQSTWRDLDDASLQLVQSRVFDLISMFEPVEAGCGVMAPDLGCFSALFTDGAYGSESDPDLPCVCTRDGIVGWTGCDDDSLVRTKLSIKHSFRSTFVRSYEIFGAAPALQPSTLHYSAYSNGTLIASATHFHTAGAGVDDTLYLNLQADTIVVEIEPDDFTQFMTYTFGGFKLCYAGDFPFSNQAPLTFEHVFDFTVSDEGWTAQQGSYGSGGWNAVSTNFDSYWYMTVNIYIYAASARLTSVSVEFDYTAGDHTIDFGDTNGIYEWSPYDAMAADDYSTTPSSPYTWEGDRTMAHNLLVQFIPGITTSDPANGSCKITRITVRGIGSDPF